MRASVLAGLSGGVDSAVAALLLQRNGYKVTGLYIDTGFGGNIDLSGLAKALGIKIYTFPARRKFQKEVISRFVKSYAAGLTPNPCLVCNRKIKFASLLEAARRYRCDFVATGHYARISYSRRQGRFFIRRHASRYDQSYFLYNLEPGWLEKIKFPLAYLDKEKAEAIAEKEGLLPFLRPRPSQDICFVAGDYRRFLRQKAARLIRPAAILHRSGRYLGQGASHMFYTVGQREGLGISWPQPLYVLEKRADKNVLVVGEKKFLGRSKAILRRLNLFVDNLPLYAKIKIRYRSPLCSARIEKRRRSLHLKFSAPQAGVAPGQAGVIYQRGKVLGGGIIS